MDPSSWPARRSKGVDSMLIGIKLGASLVLVCIVVSQVNASLIHIYHRYKPHATAPPSVTPTESQQQQLQQILNSTSHPFLVSQANGEQMSPSSAAAAMESQELSSREIEFSSPMKRIMELISHHHSPLIVVSSSEAPQAQTQIPSPPSGQQATIISQSQEPVKSTDNSMLSLVQAPLGSTQFQLTNDQRQWTLINPNMASGPQMMQPQMLTGQQQQLIQTAVPYEQAYYLNGNDLGGGGAGEQQFAVLPAGFPAYPGQQQQPSHQQQMTFTTNPQVAAAAQQQIASMQQQVSHLDNSQTQPIFLSSYVPEIPVQTIGGNKQITNPFGLQPQQVMATPQQSSQTSLPNSIQQIQQAQDQPQDSASKSSEAKKSDAKSDDPDDIDTGKSKSSPESGSGDGDDPDNYSTNKREREEINYDPDEDEPGAKAKRSNNDESEEPSSGSLTYEDKYDSDKDGDRKPERGAESRSGGSASFRASPSSGGPMANGLVNVGLNDDCMQCICRASSGCDYLLRCITRGADEKYCGPFQLTEEYWTKAGSLRDSSNNFNSFEECANDIDCAAETVTNYMKKYHKDCDGDENITCMDYARLHRLRPNECDNTEKLANHFDSYWAKFQRCAEGYNRTRDGEDEDI